MDKADIIQRIGYIRTRAKLTQKALSNAIGMNPSYINRLESAQNFLPSLDVLLTIIDVCGSTPEEFFYHDITAYRSDMEFSESFRSLPTDIKKLVMNYDPELMNLFVRMNEKAVSLSEKGLRPAQSKSKPNDD